jgi:excisionase family DNA binding protein
MQDAQDTWLTIAEAATQLGCSVDTIRRRIRRGEVVAEQVPTQRGPAWRVKLGTLLGSQPTVGSMLGSNAMHVEAPLLAQLLADAQAELVRKAEAAAMWQARAEFLAGQLEQAQLALAAPKQPASQERPFLRDSEGVPVESTQTPARTPQRAPWWMPWRRAGV